MTAVLRPCPPHVLAFALAVAFLPCTLGCGRVSGRGGTLEGKVFFEGKPVAEGVVVFSQEESSTAGEASIEFGGTYRLTKPIPVGEYKVTVRPATEGGKDARSAVREKPAPDIPQRYRWITSTDLKATVKEGPNFADFLMTK